MTKPNWTPELWEAVYDGSSTWTIAERKDPQGFPIAFIELFDARGEEETIANVSRIVTCINALAGIPNPQEFVEAAKDLLKEANLLMSDSVNHLEKAINRLEKAMGER